MEKKHQKDFRGSVPIYLRRYWRKRKARFPYLTAESVGLGMLLAAVGGFLDAYTFISRNGVFATSQTGNLVLLGVKMAQGQWVQGVRHIPPIIAFVAGVFASQVFKQPRITQILPDPTRTVLLVEMIVLTVVGELPKSVSNMVVTVMIAFVSSVQISSFRKLLKWQYNSAMVTGNLRTAAEAAYIAFFSHDRQAAKQSFNFFSIIFSFLAGALLGTISTLYLGTKAIWITSGILIIALVVLVPQTNRLTS